MDSTTQKNGTSDKRTKAQLLQELRKVEKELAATRLELEDREGKLDSLNEDIERKMAELAEAKTSLEEKTQESRRLQETLAEQQAQLDAHDDEEEHQREMEGLREKLAQAESAREQAKLELRESERQTQKQKKDIDQLEKQLRKLEAKSTPADSASIPASASTFRIDMYLREGQLSGRIVHSLSRENKAFSGVDASTIQHFISTHLPQVDSDTSVPAPELEIASAAAPIPAVVAEDGGERLAPRQPSFDPMGGDWHPLEEKSAAQSERISRLSVFKESPHQPTTLLHASDSFNLLMAFDFSDAPLPEALPLNYNVSVYAKRIGSRNERPRVGQFQDRVPETRATVASVLSAQPLPKGDYRLEAVVTVQQLDGTPVPYAATVEGGLIQVV